MLVALCVTLCLLACESEKADDTSSKEESGTSAEETRPELVPIEPGTPAELPERLVKHMGNLMVIGLPLTDVCEEFGVEMNAFFDLIQPDFEAAASAGLDADSLEALETAYEPVSTLASRCLKDENGRRFANRLINQMKAIRGS